jgi:DNA processing protein
VLGEWEVVHEPAIAIVGTRNASTYGKACSLKFSEAFAEAGVTVISGGALGIDGCAHKGALNVGGKTAAVMFTGLDKTYPREHAGLFQKVRSDGGCLISQFTTGQKPAHETRPLIRNQIIAALAQAVVVIEAPAQSGSLSTVHAANDLGRPVFVVPANVDNLNFKGSHALIRDGATLVDHPFQVLNALGIEPKLRDRPAPQVNDPQRKILLALSEKPLSSEMIVERTGLPTADVLSELTMLELEGIILRDVGGFAIRP